MSSRPLDWSAVGWDRDPTPGDPDAVAELAARFRRTAEAVRTAADGLKSIRSSDSYKGEGGEELRERTRDLAGKVREVEERYAEAADALAAYHPEQYAAQRLADDALRRAIAAQSQQYNASSTLWQFPAPPADGTVEDPQLTMARGAAQRAEAEAREMLRQAERDVRQAYEWQQDAGARAASRLKDVIAHDRLSDSNWDDVKGNALAVVKGLARVMDVIATVAGVLALVLAWVPVVGQVLALVALVATAISFIAHLTLLVTGQGSLRSTVMAFLGVVTAGLVRVATKGGRAAVAVTRVRARTLTLYRTMPKRPPRRLGRRPESKRQRADRLIGGRLTKGEGDLGNQMRKKPLAKIDTAARRSLSPKVLRTDFVTARKNFWTEIRNQRRPSIDVWRREVVTPWRSTFDPLDRVDPKLLASPEVSDIAAEARRYRLAAQLATVADRTSTADAVAEQLIPDEEPIAVANLPKPDGSDAEKELQQLQDARERALADIGFKRHLVTVNPDRDAVPAGPPYRDAAARP